MSWCTTRHQALTGSGAMPDHHREQVRVLGPHQGLDIVVRDAEDPPGGLAVLVEHALDQLVDGVPAAVALVVVPAHLPAGVLLVAIVVVGLERRSGDVLGRGLVGVVQGLERVVAPEVDADDRLVGGRALHLLFAHRRTGPRGQQVPVAGVGVRLPEDGHEVQGVRARRRRPGRRRRVRHRLGRRSVGPGRRVAAAVLVVTAKVGDRPAGADRHHEDGDGSGGSDREPPTPIGTCHGRPVPRSGRRFHTEHVVDLDGARVRHVGAAAQLGQQRARRRVVLGSELGAEGGDDRQLSVDRHDLGAVDLLPGRGDIGDRDGRP